MYTIRFKFEQAGLEPVTIENVEPGLSILEAGKKTLLTGQETRSLTRGWVANVYWTMEGEQ
jgi:hypothetical protein